MQKFLGLEVGWGGAGERWGGEGRGGVEGEPGSNRNFKFNHGKPNIKM